MDGHRTMSDSRNDFVAAHPENLSALKLNRSRAVDNDYLDKIDRPASAPFNHVTRLTNHREVLPRTCNRLESRCHSTGSTLPPPIARNLKPGGARRVVNTPSRPPKPCNLTQPLPVHIINPSVNHTENQFPIITLQQTNIASLLASSLPSSPSSIEGRERLRHQDLNSNPVRVQPRSLATDDDKSCKRSLLVELDRETTTKARCKESEKTDTRSNRKSRRPSSDSDHALIEIVDGKTKPGEHDYPCPRCGKCMCPYCKGEKRGTPEQRLLCGNRCLCNCDSIIDVVTCFCCVRTCFYHCSNRENDEICSVKPCSCQEQDRCARWTAVVALTPLLPCLLCYPVARGCVKVCRTCNECLKPGCRCKESNR